MLARSLLATGITCLLGAYYVTRKHPIPLTNPHLAHLLVSLDQKHPRYSLALFKTLLKLHVLARDQQLGRHLLGHGFDPSGDYLEEIEGLGFGGVEVGPTCFNPSDQDEKPFHLGVKAALANICSYRIRNPASSFKIHLRVQPNLQVLRFAPYLMRENLMQAVQAYVESQLLADYLIVDVINVEFGRADGKLEGTDTPEVRSMVAEVQMETEQLIKGLQEKRRPRPTMDFEGTRTYVDWKQLLEHITQERPL